MTLRKPPKPLRCVFSNGSDYRLFGERKLVLLCVQKQPVPVDEMVELTPVVPLQSAPPPTKSNDPTDDENGWIVPIDQLAPDDLDQPEVQISKL